MSSVKISNFPVPFALPVAASINGTETLPVDQTVGGVVTTVSSTFARLLGPISITSYSTGGVVIAAPTAARSALTIAGIASSGYANPAVRINGASTTDQSNGLFINAGTSVNDAGFVIANAANTYNQFAMLGDGSWTFGRSGAITTLAGAAAGNISVSAPSSGIAFSVGGISSGVTASFNVGSTVAQFAQVATIGSSGGDYPYFGYNFRATGVSGNYNYAVTDFASAIVFPSGGMQIRTAASGIGAAGITWAIPFSITNAGNATIAAPTSGLTLTCSGVSGVGANHNFKFQGGTTAGDRCLLVNGGVGSTDYCGVFNNAAATKNMLLIRGDGLVQAGGGSNSPNGELMGSITALTTGAGAATGTLTNAPSAGNPTKWIKINDAGTIRSIPAW